MASLHADWSPVNGTNDVLQATARLSTSDDQLPLVEAFVTKQHHIVVELDAIPINRFAVHVSSLDPAAALPVSVHVGFSVSSPHEWITPFDLDLDNAKDSTSKYSACHTVPQSSSNSDRPTGLSFVVALADSSFLRDHDGTDFHVGAANSTLPSVVELPLSLPLPADTSVSRTMSVYSKSPFWLYPHWSPSLTTVRDDTFFLLAELDCPSSTDRYAALLLQADERAELRATLFSHGLRLESGRCAPLRSESVRDAAVATFSIGPDPFSAMGRAVAAAQSASSFSLRTDKLTHPRWPSLAAAPGGVLSSLGYCTWDAYGWDVHQRDVATAVHWLRDANVPIGYVIVDDGWQGGGNLGPFFQHSKDEERATDQATLISLDANEKFSGSLRGVVEEHGLNIFAWIAAIGYWGGISGKHCDMKTMPVSTVLPRGGLRNKADEVTKPGNRLEVLQPHPDVVREFFDSYFIRTMAAQGVFSAKVDTQGLIGTLCDVKSPHAENVGQLTRHKVIRAYRDALTSAADRAFPNGAIINSMACGPELVFTSGKELTPANVCWRTSDDHAYHTFEETDGAVVWHIICNAMNTILLGEIFPAPDWDMFRACAPNARPHAAARVLSGGPIYISDTPPEDTATAAATHALLHSLTTHDGTLLRCKDVGRTAIDSLFEDPRQSPARFFKIFNTNPVLGIVGLFNLALDVAEVSDVTGAFSPCDVADFARLPAETEFVSLVMGGKHREAFYHASKTAAASVTVPLLDVALAHICPVIDVKGGVQVAILGQSHLMNSGGTVVGYETDASSKIAKISFDLHDHGETLLWMAPDARAKLTGVTAKDGSALSNSVVTVGSMQLQSVMVPDGGPYSLTLSFDV